MVAAKTCVPNADSSTLKLVGRPRATNRLTGCAVRGAPRRHDPSRIPFYLEQLHRRAAPAEDGPASEMRKTVAMLKRNALPWLIATAMLCASAVGTTSTRTLP